MNSECGLGLPDVKPALKVFLPFFIQVILPYQIKRGEVLTLDIVIFNYLSKSQSVTVSFQRNDQEFEAVDPDLYGWSGEMIHNSKCDRSF